MDKDLKNFFKDLVEAHSPSGFEQPAQEVYRNFVKKYADNVTTDVHGNVIALKKGTEKIKFMISGHADEIGLMINYIDDNGYLFFVSIGGVDASILPGLRVDIYHNKKRLTGIIGKKPIHAISGDDANKPPKIEDLWIDIGAKDKKDAEKRVSIGDIVTFSKGMETLANNLVTTKATDNKVGVFVAGALLQELSKDKQLKANVYAVSTVQEEVGLRGATTSAFGIDPHVGIAVDVTIATDYPTLSKAKYGDISLNKGPAVAVGSNINPKVFELLKKAGDKGKIKYQIEPCPRATGTDANAIQKTKAGVATGLVSIPNRYMHTPIEVISLKDLEDAVKLIAGFVRMLSDTVDFTPGV